MALRRPPPPRSWTQYAVVRTFMRCNFAALRFTVGWVAQLARKAPMRHARASRTDVVCKRMRREYALKLFLVSHNFCPWSHAHVFTMPCLCSRKRASGFAPGPFPRRGKVVGSDRLALRIRAEPADGRKPFSALGNAVNRSPIARTTARLSPVETDFGGRSRSRQKRRTRILFPS